MNEPMRIRVKEVIEVEKTNDNLIKGENIEAMMLGDENMNDYAFYIMQRVAEALNIDGRPSVSAYGYNTIAGYLGNKQIIITTEITSWGDEQ